MHIVYTYTHAHTHTHMHVHTYTHTYAHRADSRIMYREDLLKKTLFDL